MNSVVEFVTCYVVYPIFFFKGISFLGAGVEVSNHVVVIDGGPVLGVGAYSSEMPEFLIELNDPAEHIVVVERWLRPRKGLLLLWRV